MTVTAVSDPIVRQPPFEYNEASGTVIIRETMTRAEFAKRYPHIYLMETPKLPWKTLAVDVLR